MSWTDERVELLSLLWMEGKSASQIAGLLGGGLTRNAVIGKVHRLGLAGRVKPTPSAPADAGQSLETMGVAASARRAAPRTSVASASVAASASLSATVARTVGATALSLSPATTPAPSPKPQPAPEENVVALSLKVTIVDLRENMCKWPLGDPSSAEFRYCGAAAYATTPYCQHHGKIAYQPAQDRRRDRDRRPMLAR